MRGEIWTQPKVFAISLICILKMDFLAGNREKAIAFLQSEDADAQRNAHTLGIVFRVSIDNNQIAPGVVQPLNSESSTPLGRDQMPRHCDRVKRSFLAVVARGIAIQS